MRKVALILPIVALMASMFALRQSSRSLKNVERAYRQRSAWPGYERDWDGEVDIVWEHDPGDPIEIEVTEGSIEICEPNDPNGIKIMWEGDPNELLVFDDGVYEEMDVLVTTVDGDLYLECLNVNEHRLTDQSIRRLCKSGRVCEVMGHLWNCRDSDDWDQMWHVETLEINPPGHESRYCGLCGKTETRSLSDWE
jgi:hypothetical protein